jgi:tetratricopeptide (TPR) repeat protein
MGAIAVPDVAELLEEGTTYQIAGMLDKALERFNAAASHARSPLMRSIALRKQADVFRTRCQWADALQRARAAFAIAEEEHLNDAAAEALNSEAAVYHARGELERATGLYHRMLSLSQDSRVRGIALQNLGTLAAMRGDHQTAEQRFSQSYRAFRDAGYERGMTLSLNNYGRSALERNNHELAEVLFMDAEHLALELNDFDLANMCILNRAEALVARSALDEAVELVSRAIGHFGMTDNQWRRLECLRLLGDIGRERGNLTEAALYYEAALSLARRLDAKLEIESLQERLRFSDAEAGTITEPV